MEASSISSADVLAVESLRHTEGRVSTGFGGFAERGTVSKRRQRCQMTQAGRSVDKVARGRLVQAVMAVTVVTGVGRARRPRLR